MGDELQEGPAGWAPWVREHAAKWLLYARQQTRAEADAQDVVQEALAEAWRRTPVGRLPAASLVFATIRRRAVDLARRNERRAAREVAAHALSPLLHFDAASPDDAAHRQLQQALGKLTPAFREVVTLKIWGELSFTEIGLALDIPANTASSRYRYGLEELRELTKEVLHER